MSVGAMNIQAQVESVLGALLKAATVELTELFESRYRASAPDVAVDADSGRSESDGRDATAETLDTKRSIGVQVEPLEAFGGNLSTFFFRAATSCLRPRLGRGDRCARNAG